MVRRCISLEWEVEQRTDEIDDSQEPLCEVCESLKLRQAAAEAENADLKAHLRHFVEEERRLREALSCVRGGQLLDDAGEVQPVGLASLVERILDEADDLRSRLAGSTEEVKLYRSHALQERESARNQITKLEAEVAHLMSERDIAHQQGFRDLSEVQRQLDDAVQERDSARHRCVGLEAKMAIMESKLKAAKAELLEVSEKASSLWARLSASYGGVPVRPGSSSPSSSGASDASTVLGVVGNSLVPQAAPYRDAALIAEVGRRLHERGEMMRLFAEGVELRECARPLEEVLTESLIEEHHTRDADAVATGYTRLSRNAAHSHRLDTREAQLNKRATQLKEKERQLLCVAHELQAKSRALQALYMRVAEKPPSASRLLLTADGGDAFHTTSQRHGTGTTFREAVRQLDGGVPPDDGTAETAMYSDPVSPLPRVPPQPLMQAVRRGAEMLDRSDEEVAVTDIVEETPERLTAATEAYRDVLYEHILESNGLQGMDALTRYLPRRAPGSGLRTPRVPSSDMAAKTRAMLRELEDRLGNSRAVPRGVDPAVQQRSLEAFRRLEAAMCALCGDRGGQ
uniref:Uncharacterized protein n=1 Tax=Leishmania guyanensis TaxID=5670 RepID=A0A1E1INB4_LEIGU|nr:hypothetical protein BN36_0301480 [Leishmania guyanensis]